MRRIAWLLAGAAVLNGQTLFPRHQTVGWYVYNGDHPLGSSRWGIHFDIQPRFENMTGDIRQFLFRPAVTYQVSPRVLVTAGYAFRNDWLVQEDRRTDRVNEHRLHQQIRFAQGAGSWRLQHRGWVEQRFVERPDPFEGRQYFTRFRYQFQAAHDIGRDYYGVTSFEPFWRTPGLDHRLEQTRAYVGFGKRLGDQFRMEAGYQHQWFYRDALVQHLHVVILTLFSNAKLR